MSGWAGFTDEELSRLRQQNVGEHTGSAPGGRKKATINTVKRQRPREKIRTKAPSSEGKASLDKLDENAEDQGDSVLSVQRSTSSSSANSSRRSTSRFDSREEERENSSPECERRAKGKQMLEEAPPKNRAIKKTEEPCKDTMKDGDSGVEKNVSDLPEIIDESEK